MISTTLRRAVPVLALAALLASAAVAASAAAHASPPGLRPGQAQPAVTVPTGFQPAAASFVSARSGYVLGGVGCTPEPDHPCLARLAATTDGGRHWYLTGAPDVRIGGAVSSVLFASRADGWLYGPGLRYTRDGGAHWHIVSLPGVVESMAAGAGTVYAAVAPPGHKAPELFASPAGRNAWTRVGHFTAARPILAVSGRAAWFANAGYGTSASTYVQATADGTHWHRYPLNCPAGYNLAGIAAASRSDVAFLCTNAQGTFHTYKAVLRSANGGRTDHLAGHAPIEGDVNGQGGSFAVPPGRASVITIAVYFAGPSFLDRSADGGKTWTQIPVPGGNASATFTSLSYVNRTTGWVVTSQPDQLQRTSDAGRTWHQVRF
jgi:photosystem II stability/assembly factor-like uncharacterized protein